MLEREPILRRNLDVSAATFAVGDPDPTISHALFAAWAPSDRPEIVVAVFIERGGVGGIVAAPVARAIVDGYFTRVRHRGRKAPARRGGREGW